MPTIMKRYLIAIIFTLSFANPNAAKAEVVPPEVFADPIIPIVESDFVTVQTLPQTDFKEFKPLTPIEPPKPARTLGSGSFGANTYARGNCTWFSKQQRPDLPSSLGNAKYWNERARAAGWNVGSKPFPDSVGVSESGYAGHVFIVRHVNPDGSFIIEEMNWLGFGMVSSRTIPNNVGYEFIY